MKNIKNKFQQIQYLNSLSSYISFYKKYNNIPRDINFLVAQFELKYQILKLQDFSDEFLIQEASVIGNSILKITGYGKN